MLRHRLGQTTFFWSLIETAKWTPMFLVFFGGLSWHLSKAILCHFFKIKMEWTTTAKELEEHGFRAGLDRIAKDFKSMYLFLIPIAGGMIYLALYAPRGWRINDFAAIVPLANQVGCHALLPVSFPNCSKDMAKTDLPYSLCLASSRLSLVRSLYYVFVSFSAWLFE